MDLQPPLGVTLKYFHRFVDDHGGRDCFQGLTTLEVCEQFIKPYTSTSQLSLVDHVLSQPRGHEYTKPAQWLISHSWSYQFLDVVDAIDGFCHEQELSPDTSFWFCLFANNQHAIGEPSAMFKHFLQAFRSALEFTGKMVMVLSPWHDPETLKRTWCVYEVYLSIVLNARFEVAMGTTQKLDFLADIKKPYSILRMLGQINSSNSITTVPSDRGRIFELIEDLVGFVKLDRMVLDVLQGWIMRSLDKQIEHATNAEERFKWVFTKAMRYYEDEKYETACMGFQLSVEIFKASLSPSFWQGWEAQLYEGTCSAKQHHARETWEPICDEAFSKLQLLVGRSHPALFRGNVELGDAYCWSMNFDRGMPLLVEALALADEFHGAQEALDTKQRVGIYLTRQRRLTEAEVMLRLAYDGFCELYGPVHSTTVVCRENLAVCYVQQGRFREGEAIMAWNFKELQRTRGEMHPEILPTRMNLGVAQRMLGKYDDAEKNIQRSMEDLERDGNHLFALLGQRQLGVLKFCQGDLFEAKTCLKAAHDAYLETLAPTNMFCRNILAERYIVSFDVGSEFDSIEQVEAFQLLLQAADIDNDTWSNFACHKCYQPIDGNLALCAQCPRLSVMFCTRCVAVPGVQLVCGHHDGPWHVIPHPTRYLRERKVLLLAQSHLMGHQGKRNDEPRRVPRTFLLVGATIATALAAVFVKRCRSKHDYVVWVEASLLD